MQIVTDEGLKFLVIVPDRLRDKLHVGNWVVIQPTEDGSQHPPEILEVINTPRMRFYETNNL